MHANRREGEGAVHAPDLGGVASVALPGSPQPDAFAGCFPTVDGRRTDAMVAIDSAKHAAILGGETLEPPWVKGLGAAALVCAVAAALAAGIAVSDFFDG